MLYERLLDLAPHMRLERRLAERVAARLAVGLLLAVPVCLAAAILLVAAAVHAILARICTAGLLAGASVRHGLDGIAGHGPRRSGGLPGPGERRPVARG